jgi:outer membrane protein assembly factor BamB
MLKKVGILAIKHENSKLFGRFGGIRLFINASILIGLCTLPFSYNSNCFAANWLHFGYDNNYASRNPVENTIGINNVSQLQRRWGLGCDDGYFRVISRSPALYNGNLYTTSAGSILQAYNARTGQQLWTFGTSGSGWNPQPVASEDGVVFYLPPGGSGFYDLYSVNANAGTEIWKSPISFDLG